MGVAEPSLPDLVEVLGAEQRRRWWAGERVVTETYFALHPRLLADTTCALRLVYNEVLLREADGDGPGLDEYARRFPQFTDQLAPLFEVHRALESEQLLAAVGDQTCSYGTSPGGGAELTGPWPTVAGHEILGELGRGGMGVVYKARQLGLNRVVALKMILAASYADPAQLARFRAEARSVAQLQHPHIVQIHDVGEQDGRPYFSLEYIDGGSLAQKLKATPQPARAAATLIETLARAIHTAHQAGLVHRDLKPANVLLTADGTPKITDFGLAKRLLTDAGQTGSGMIVGTPSYMAPEQADGRVREVGPAADVYALGAILYELLTGRPPFKAETQLETLRQVLAAEPVPLSRFHLKVPRDLDTICRKCLQKEPHKRYASALSLAEDLERFLADQPILARRTSPLERSWRWCRRNPGVALLAASVAGLLLLLAGGASVAALWLSKELARAERAEHAAQQEKEAATDQLWKASFAQAQALHLSGRMGQRFESLKAIKVAARIRRAGEPPTQDALALRSEAIACLALADLRVFDDWPIPTRWQASVAFDAELARYAFGDDQGDIHVRRTAGHQEIAHLAGLGRPFMSLWTGFSPDGRFLLVEYHLEPKKHHCLVWELAAPNNPRVALRVDNGYQFQFSPDSRSLAVGRQDGTLGLYDLIQGTARTLCRDVGGNPLAFRPNGRDWGNQLAFRPDGKQLAFSDAQKPEIRILDMATGKLLQPLPHVGENTALAWSSDNRFLAAASDNRSIYIWNAPERRQQAVLVGHQVWVSALAFHPAGCLLVSAGSDGTTRLWDPMSGRQLVSSLGQFHNFSPDGGRLSFRKGTQMGIWELADGRECRLLQPRTERTAAWLNYISHECIDYSPDGRWLASVGGDGVRLWDTAAGREMAHLPIGYHEATLFQPRGNRLFTYGRTGLKSWPIASVSGKSGIQIGSPQTLKVPPNTGWFRACCSLDGRVLAVTDDSHGQIIVLKVEAPSERVVLSHCSDVVSLALSHDGQWVAAGLAKGSAGISVWDAHSGRPVHRWPEGKDGDDFHVAFSPDGQWLVIGGPSDYRAWKVGSWEPGLVIAREDTALLAGPVAFSRDGRLLAITGSQQQVQLFDFAKQRALATLSAPDARRISRLCFNHDGSELAVSTDNHVVQLWDLRAIRRQLQALNLDWDLPPAL